MNNTAMAAVGTVLLASLVAGGWYLVIAKAGMADPEQPTSAATSLPSQPSLTNVVSEPRPRDREDNLAVPVEVPEARMTPADVSAQLSNVRPYQLPTYLYQVSSNKFFANALAHHDTLTQELARTVYGDDVEAKLILHKDGVHFCNVVLWKPFARPTDDVLYSMKTLLNQGALLRTASTYCACPQSGSVIRPNGGSINVVRCHDDPLGDCDWSPPPPM